VSLFTCIDFVLSVVGITWSDVWVMLPNKPPKKKDQFGLGILRPVHVGFGSVCVSISDWGQYPEPNTRVVEASTLVNGTSLPLRVQNIIYVNCR
jgi:hypothetical protein